MSEQEAVVTRRRRLPAVWVIPLVAALLGLWMIYHEISSRGPVVTLSFQTAEGIEAGKTVVKSRNVAFGVVESVVLSPDRESVSVTLQLDPGAERFLHEDTQFWVVRARVAMGGISGLGTLLSGGYIELAPGVGKLGRRDFVGLEEPPVTPAGTPGVRFTLTSERAGSVNPGDPVLHRGFTVGRVERAVFDVERERMVYDAFVRAPFDRLVRTDTRFWNASGIEFTADASGLRVRTGTAESLLGGGVEFAARDDHGDSAPIRDGAAFELYSSYESAQDDPFSAFTEYVVLVDHSVRGLKAGAAVEFRGTPVGRVVRVMLENLLLTGTGRTGAPMPVLIRLEPGRLRMLDNTDGVDRLRESVEAAVENGLYAHLETGNLLTGQLIVGLDFYPDEEPGALGDYQGFTTLPTLGTGLEQLQQKLVTILDEIGAIPLAEIGTAARQTLDQSTETLATLDATLSQVDEVLTQDAVGNLPGELTATLSELQRALDSYSEGSPLYERIDRTLLEVNRTLRRMEGLARSIEEEPRSLLFPTRREPDPEPGASP